jgi:magnesium chelatase family protein
MSSKIFSAALVGLEAEIIEVEAEIGGGELGSFAIVGLPDLAVSESRERVRSAVRNSKVEFPRIKVTVNLAPANLKKQGPNYDLPIAISILAVAKKIPFSSILSSSIFIGELALSGKVRPVQGVLSITMAAKKYGYSTIFLPVLNAAEASLISGIEVRPVITLQELIAYLKNKGEIQIYNKEKLIIEKKKPDWNMSEIVGQEYAKRAIEIAAAGGHNLLMIGSPGSGKTLLAKTILSILPDLEFEEAIEVTKIYSASGNLKSENKGLIQERPFRSPHHSASATALVGGGSWPRPGEVSLAHRGVLFLDEFGEFSRVVLEHLRQPLEDGHITISRAAGNLLFPANFMLVAAMNPCSCGYYGDTEKQCSCSLQQIIQYKKRISGPILDRIDLHIEVPRVALIKLTDTTINESSEIVKARVAKARQLQAKRFNFMDNCKTRINSEMSSAQVKKVCNLNQVSLNLMQSAADRLHLSARAYFRVLKVARTIADLEQSIEITSQHLAEALQYRQIKE